MNKFEKAGVEKMPPVTQGLHGLVISAGFSLLEARKITGGPGRAVDHLEYMNGAGERVYIITHGPPETIGKNDTAAGFTKNGGIGA